MINNTVGDIVHVIISYTRIGNLAHSEGSRNLSQYLLMFSVRVVSVMTITVYGNIRSKQIRFCYCFEFSLIKTAVMLTIE